MARLVFLVLFLCSLVYTQDFNQDGVVDNSDRDSLALYIGDSLSTLVDATGDGRVDGRDFFVWAAHKGDTLTLTSPSDGNVRFQINKFPTKTDSFRIERSTSDYPTKGNGILLYENVVDGSYDDTLEVGSNGVHYIVVFYYDSFNTWQGWTKGIADSVIVGSVDPGSLVQSYVPFDEDSIHIVNYGGNASFDSVEISIKSNPLGSWSIVYSAGDSSVNDTVIGLSENDVTFNADTDSIFARMIIWDISMNSATSYDTIYFGDTLKIVAEPDTARGVGESIRLLVSYDDSSTTTNSDDDSLDMIMFNIDTTLHLADTLVIFIPDTLKYGKDGGVLIDTAFYFMKMTDGIDWSLYGEGYRFPQPPP
jgi:hypothetical protein